MAKQRVYNDETKAAVMAALLAGQSVSSVAREYKIPKGTVSDWKRKAAGEASGAKPTQKRAAIGDLLVDYLETNLHTLKEQSRLFSDHEWLRGQDASQLAVLHGVVADKTVRLLEALGGSDGDGGTA